METDKRKGRMKRKRIEPRLIVFVFFILSVFLAVYILQIASPDGDEFFIVRSDDAMYLTAEGTNKRFRFVGGNHFNLLVKYLWGEYHGLTGEEVFNISAEHDVRVIRFWATCSNGYWSDQCLYFGSNNWKNSRQDFLEKFDELVDDAERHGVYLIPVLSDGYYTFEWMGSTTGLNDTRVCQVGSDANLEYKRFVKDIVSRYRDREIILAWEIGNEGHHVCDDWEDLMEWYDDTAGYIRELDPNHLISTGENNFGSMDKAKFNDVHSSENIDLTSVHIYDEDLYKITDFEEGTEAEVFTYYWTSVSHNELNRPIYFGEVGTYDVSANPGFYSDFLEAAYNSDVDGVIVWSWLEGGDCERPADQGGSCVTPARTPEVAERISYWAEKFAKQ